MNRSRYKAITLLAMCFALFMAHIDGTVVNVALPKIQSSLGSDVSGLQWVANADSLLAACLVLTSGTLSDMYGRKRVFLVGAIICMIASVICGFAPNLGILIAGRFLQGIGNAALIPTSLAILAGAFPNPKEKTKAISIWSAVSGIALIAGPVLGGLLVDTLGWQSVFLINLPLGAIAFWLTFSFVRDSKNQKQQRLDVPGLLLSIVFLASFTYAIIEFNARFWRSPLLILLLTLAGISLLAFLAIEYYSSHPMLPLKLFKNPTFTIVNVVSVLVFFTVASLLFIFSLFLQQVQGYSAAAAGLRFLPMNIAFVSAALVSGWLATQLGWRLTIAIGLMLAGIATLLFLRINVDTEYKAIVLSLVISGFGCGLTLAPIAAAAMSSAPPTQAGIASAVLNTSNSLGGISGIALQGTILKQYLASDLARSLSAWNLPANLQGQLIADVLQNGAKVPSNLPANITPSALHQAIDSAFISGLHATVVVASFALFTGALLILVFVPQAFNKENKLVTNDK
ncbi:MFS transporter [Nostoc sp. FACHB-152]|uniref:MFS transporter n=1 Tax=unclassified Nostoc TaxID=2593658 RepID=UPI0016830956|nr:MULTISPECIES: MFS transporter [unclassified Nostoc]MBD2448812.1 MFS transporter [Nostoc sp. FACHB-152]MBD2467592.1 MFS transporter [Nostoc sp. FACHB-145]